jgi:hypothetical protein
MTTQTVFERTSDLARLPWFEVQNGRLTLRDRTVGPIIDCHTHLALAFVLPMRVDLEAITAETAYYLPPERRVDLDLYINRNFTPERLRQVKRDLTLGSLTASGLRATHTLGNLGRDMADLGITHSVLLPIDFPLISTNAETVLSLVRGREAYVGLGSVHPFSPDVPGKLDRQLALGARGVKFHPTVQVVPPDHPRARRLYRGCAERRMVVFFHCGPVGIEPWLGRRFTQVRRYERAIAENPDVVFVLGHAGALQWEEALALACRYPNVYLEISSQSLSAVRRIVEVGPAGRVVFGTDWPWYHQGVGLAKVLLATEDRPEVRRKVLFENAARLFGVGS